MKKIDMGPYSNGILQPLDGGLVVAESVDGWEASVISTASDNSGAYELILREGTIR